MTVISGTWLDTVSIQFCGRVRCCICSCEGVHDHICDFVWGDCPCVHTWESFCLVTSEEGVLIGPVSACQCQLTSVHTIPLCQAVYGTA